MVKVLILLVNLKFWIGILMKRLISKIDVFGLVRELRYFLRGF